MQPKEFCISFTERAAKFAIDIVDLSRPYSSASLPDVVIDLRDVHELDEQAAEITEDAVDYRQLGRQAFFSTTQ